MYPPAPVGHQAVFVSKPSKRAVTLEIQSLIAYGFCAHNCSQKQMIKENIQCTSSKVAYEYGYQRGNEQGTHTRGTPREPNKPTHDPDHHRRRQRHNPQATRADRRPHQPDTEGPPGCFVSKPSKRAVTLEIQSLIAYGFCAHICSQK